MLFSNKISNSVLNYLEGQRSGLEKLYSSMEIPEEFLRDPSSWIEAEQMEQFLKNAQNFYDHPSEGNETLIDRIGHMSSQLRSWGVLDSVLKMMKSPEDIFSQPERLLSYFISPQLNLKLLEKKSNRVSFETHISQQEYPFVTRYLKSALEALPNYWGQDHCEVTWNENVIDVQWTQTQKSFFAEDEIERVISPELFQSLISDLEKKQRELELKNRELIEKNRLLEFTQNKLEASYKEKIYTEKLSGLSELAMSVAHEINNPLSYVNGNLSRLHDYLVRSQQLVTILVGQDRETAQVKEAMRRMDWSFIVHDFPKVVKEMQSGMQKVRDIVKDLSFLTGSQSLSEERTPVDLNHLIEEAVKMIRLSTPTTVQIETHYFLDRLTPVYTTRLEQAIVNILNNAVQSIDGNGMVRVITRPQGNKVEIEISDTGVGMDSQKIKSIFKPFYTTKQPGRGSGLGLTIAHSIVQMHGGKISAKSQVGIGSTFLIELPQEVTNIRPELNKLNYSNSTQIS